MYQLSIRWKLNQCEFVKFRLRYPLNLRCIQFQSNVYGLNEHNKHVSLDRINSGGCRQLLKLSLLLTVLEYFTNMPQYVGENRSLISVSFVGWIMIF